MTEIVWVQLYFGDEAFETPAKIIDVHDVYDLKKAVKAEFPNALQHIDAARLQVFPDGTTSSTKEKLKSSASVPTNTTYDSPLAIFAPMTAQQAASPQQGLATVSRLQELKQLRAAPQGAKKLEDEVQWLLKNPQLKEAHDAFNRFCAVGAQIQSDEKITELVEIVNNLIKLNPTPMPFFVVDGPSGIGKTQLGFALRHHFDVVLHLCLSDPSDLSQPIYKALQLAFDNGLFLSFAKLESRNIPSEELSMCGSLDSRSYHSVAVIARLLGADTQKMSALELAKFVQESGKSVVVILDETPQLSVESPTYQLVKFTRNVLRCAGIPTVMMGTNACMANMVSSGLASRGADKETVWAYLLFHLPPTNQDWLNQNLRAMKENQGAGVLTSLQRLKIGGSNIGGSNIDVLLQKLLSSSRPWLSCLILSHLQSLTFENLQSLLKGARLTAPQLDKMCVEMCKTICTAKRSIRKNARPQVCLWLPAYREKYYQPKDVEVSELITSHFAFLEQPSDTVGILPMYASVIPLHNSDSGCQLQFNHGNPSTKKTWEPSCHFPHASEEPMLYLALSAEKHFIVGKEKLTTREVFMRAAKTGSNGIDTANPKNLSRSGNTLERLTALAVCVASHAEGVKGISLLSFLPLLAGELCLGVARELAWSNNTSSNSLHTHLPNLNVPFLSPSNSDWPEYLYDGVEGADFGFLQEPANKQEVDLIVKRRGEEIVMSGECKNRGKIDSNVVTPALKNIPAGSPVHFVFVASLSNCSSSEFRTVTSGLARTWNFVNLQVAGETVELLSLADKGFPAPALNRPNWLIVIICNILEKVT